MVRVASPTATWAPGSTLIGDVVTVATVLLIGKGKHHTEFGFLADVQRRRRIKGPGRPTPMHDNISHPSLVNALKQNVKVCRNADGMSNFDMLLITPLPVLVVDIQFTGRRTELEEDDDTRIGVFLFGNDRRFSYSSANETASGTTLNSNSDFGMNKLLPVGFSTGI